jgi:hypothetical protein
MALSAGQKATVLALRQHYFKAIDANGAEVDWPVDDNGTPYQSDATTPDDTTGADTARGTALDNGFKPKIGSLAQKLQDDLNTSLDLVVELGGTT